MKLLFLILTLLLVSCNKGGDGGYGLDGKFYDHEDEAYAAINQMNLKKGDNRYTLIKLETLKWNHIVVYDSYEGKYEAWDISGYMVGMSEDITYDRIKEDGRYKDLEATPNNTFWDDSTDTLFSQIDSFRKDLEKIGASIEETDINSLSQTLIANFSLSEDRAVEMAKIFKTYDKISSKRSLTEKEKDTFSQKLLGINYKHLNQALRSGEGYDSLLQRAAELNNISPEQVNEILNQVVGL